MGVTSRKNYFKATKIKESKIILLMSHSKLRSLVVCTGQID